MGGPGFWTGCHPKPLGSKSANSPWYSNVSLAQMPWQISIVSRTCAWRRGNRCVALAAANSSGIQPDPTPTLRRPPDRWSIVAHSAANTPGERYGVSVMLMPMRIFFVRAASQGRSGQPCSHLPLDDTGSAVGNSFIMPNEYCSSPRSDASGTTMRSRVQTESKSSSSARSVRSASSWTVTWLRKLGRYRASFIGQHLLEYACAGAGGP